MKKDNPGFFRDQIWQFISVIIAVLALAIIILIWFFPNPNELFTYNQSTPITSATITPTATSTSTKQPAKPIIPSSSDYIPNTDYIPNALVRNIICIVFGIVLGFLVSLLLRGGGYGIVGDVIMGIVGAYVGYLFISLFLPASSLLEFSVSVLIGSCIAILFLRRLVGRSYRRRV